MISPEKPAPMQTTRRLRGVKAKTAGSIAQSDSALFASLDGILSDVFALNALAGDGDGSGRSETFKLPRCRLIVFQFSLVLSLSAFDTSSLELRR